MASEQPKGFVDKITEALGGDTPGTGSITPDAGPDTSRADYSSEQEPDLSDSSHDFNHADTPETATTRPEETVGEQQIRSIGRTAG